MFTTFDASVITVLTQSLNYYILYMPYLCSSHGKEPKIWLKITLNYYKYDFPQTSKAKS